MTTYKKIVIWGIIILCSPSISASQKENADIFNDSIFKEIFLTHSASSEEEIDALNEKCNQLGLALRFTCNPITHETTAYININDRAFSIPQNILETIYNHLSQHNPYHNTKATIRQFSKDTILCQEEIDTAHKRRAVCKNAIEKLINASIDEHEVPNIAVCFSGGGIRAAIGTAAASNALCNAGIWDSILYTASLSGSTWTMLPWYNSQKSFSEFYPGHLKRIATGFMHKKPDVILKRLEQYFSIFALICLQKLIFKEIPSIIDIYGLCLAFNFFELEALKNITTCTLYSQQECIKDGQRPIPLYTAITSDHYWTTFSPFEVSIRELGAVPSWAFGRKFNKGVSVNNAPPLTLDLLCGICGSAISIDFEELCDMVFDRMEPRMVFASLSYLGHATTLGDVRVFPAKIPNYTYGIKKAPLNDIAYNTFVDAGIDCNIPLPPLLELDRNIDIIIVFDMSGDVLGAPQLKIAQEYAAKNNLEFPKINYHGITDRTYTIFDDGYYSSAPVIIYIPMIKNTNYSSKFDPQDYLGIGGFMNTFNFDYSEIQINALAGLFNQAVKDVKNDLISTIKKIIKRKN